MRDVGKVGCSLKKVFVFTHKTGSGHSQLSKENSLAGVIGQVMGSPILSPLHWLTDAFHYSIIMMKGYWVLQYAGELSDFKKQ